MNLIFDGSYTAAVSNSLLMEDLSDDSNIEIDKSYYKRNNRFRRKAFQLLLLSDTVELTQADPGLSYQFLTDNFDSKIVSFAKSAYTIWEDEKSKLSTTKFKADAELYRRIVVNHLAKYYSPKRTLEIFKENGVSPNGYINCAIDLLIGKDYDEEYYKKCGGTFWDMNKEFGSLPVYNYKKLLNYQTYDVIFPYLSYIINILNQGFQANKNLCSTILNKENTKALIQRKPSYNKVSGITEAYSILTIALDKIIGSFPKVNSLKRVTELRQSKTSELKNLKEALKELNESLSNGKANSARKAEILIQRASKELNRAEKLEKIGRWVNISSLPIGVVEALLGAPPVLGLSLKSMSITNAEFIRRTRENNWLTIYRN